MAHAKRVTDELSSRFGNNSVRLNGKNLESWPRHSTETLCNRDVQRLPSLASLDSPPVGRPRRCAPLTERNPCSRKDEICCADEIRTADEIKSVLSPAVRRISSRRDFTHRLWIPPVRRTDFAAFCSHRRVFLTPFRVPLSTEFHKKIPS